MMVRIYHNKNIRKVCYFIFLSYNLIEFTITFECDYEDDHWSETAKDVHIQGRFITLKTPIFPYDITGIQSVDIILKLNNHHLASIKYHYLTTCNFRNHSRNFKLISILFLFFSFFLL